MSNWAGTKKKPSFLYHLYLICLVVLMLGLLALFPEMFNNYPLMFLMAILSYFFSRAPHKEHNYSPLKVFKSTSMVVLLLFLLLNIFVYRFFWFGSFGPLLLGNGNLPNEMTYLSDSFFPRFFATVFSLFFVYRAAFNTRQPSLRSPMKPSILLLILNIPIFLSLYVFVNEGRTLDYGTPSGVFSGGSPGFYHDYPGAFFHDGYYGIIAALDIGLLLFIIGLPFFCAYQLKKKGLKLFPKGLENFNPPKTKKTDTPTIRRFSAAWRYILFISLFCLVISSWGFLGVDSYRNVNDTPAIIGMVFSLLISVVALVFAFGQYRYFCPKCKTRCNNKIIDSTTHNTTQRRRDGAVDRRFNESFSTEYQHQYVCTNEECSHNFTEWTYRGPTWYERRDYHNLKWYNL